MNFRFNNATLLEKYEINFINNFAVLLYIMDGMKIDQWLRYVNMRNIVMCLTVVVTFTSLDSGV